MVSAELTNGVASGAGAIEKRDCNGGQLLAMKGLQRVQCRLKGAETLRRKTLRSGLDSRTYPRSRFLSETHNKTVRMRQPAPAASR